MIGYDEIVALTDRSGELYPPRGEEEQKAWWAERGVDYAGLVRFCIEDGHDSFVNSLSEVAEEAPQEAIVMAGFAMSTEIGFLLGWLACHEVWMKACAVPKDES